MRFDDMLTTVMAVPPTDAVSRQIVWRQLVDILAQERRVGDPELERRAFVSLDTLRAEVAPVVRASTAGSVAHRTTSPDLVRYFALDDPGIAAEMLRHARLSADQWCSLIAEMPTTSRSLLRGRRDLPARVTAALAAYGSADFALPAPNSPIEETHSGSGVTQIADVVARIEAFRARKAHDEDIQNHSAKTTTFELETDSEGHVNFTSARPREPIIGLNLAVAGEQWLSGVDGYAAGAFRGRSPFRGARLQIGGQSSVAGDWRLDGDPIFDPSTGRFLGYRCIARQPLAHEHAIVPEQGPSADNLRQLVHELRTPLNAILGFAEMIERELLGPIDASYRTRAAQIRSDGARLLTAIEDIDLAARLDTAQTESASLAFLDLAALLTVVGREMASLSDQRHVHLRVIRPAGSLNIVGDQPALHRLLSRLFSLLLGLADAGETLIATVNRDDNRVKMAITRPQRVQGFDEQTLLNEGNEALEGTEGAPLLGLAFGLRLLTSLAAAINVKFIVEADAFVLILVAAQDSASTLQRGILHHDDERLPS